VAQGPLSLDRRGCAGKWTRNPGVHLKAVGKGPLRGRRNGLGGNAEVYQKKFFRRPRILTANPSNTFRKKVPQSKLRKKEYQRKAHQQDVEGRHGGGKIVIEDVQSGGRYFGGMEERYFRR